MVYVVKKRLAIILFVIIEFLIIFLEIKFLTGSNGADRIFILSVVNLFGCSHLYFNVYTMYDFLYKKKYFIACLGLIILSLLGYHGSSLSAWNKAIQPNNYVESGSIVLGVSRGIRGDEYFVTTPSIISQYNNNFESVSNILMGRSGYVTMFPNLPCKSISVLGNLGYLPYLLLPLENAFAMSWFLKLFLIFFASFELCMLVTKKNRLYALMGAFVITFSGASCWWSNMLILGWGALAVVIMHLFLKSKKNKTRIIYSIIMGIVGANYLMLMYPAWQVPFGYLYLGFFIWLWIENKKELNLKLLLYVPIVLGVMFGIFLPVFIESYDIYLQTISTVFPGKRESIGGYGIDRLFTYYLSLFIPMKPFFNASEYGNFMSFYPLPIVISIFKFIKSFIKKIKVDSLLIILTIIGILLSIWNFIEIPNFISKITLLSFSSTGRSQLVVGYICIFIIIRIMSLYESEKKITRDYLLKVSYISLIFNLFIIILLNYYFIDYLTLGMNLIMFVLFFIIVCLLILNNKKTNKMMAFIFICISIITGIMVNPLSKGLDVFFEKPVAKEVRKIVNDDSVGRWLVIAKHYALPNYVVSNGGITINSTNYYPNLALWNNLDKNGDYEDIYNRYAHIQIELSYENTNFELLTPDYFKVYLNIKDLEKLDVDYILADYNIRYYMAGVGSCIYKEDGIWIYKLNKEEVNDENK